MVFFFHSKRLIDFLGRLLIRLQEGLMHVAVYPSHLPLVDIDAAEEAVQALQFGVHILSANLLRGSEQPPSSQSADKSRLLTVHIDERHAQELCIVCIGERGV